MSREQQTKVNCGVTVATGSGSDSNDVLVSVDHPDKTTGLASSSQRDLYTVDALAEPVTYQDRDGNVHTFTLDVLGRLTADAITTLGNGVDGTVRRMAAETTVTCWIHCANSMPISGKGTIASIEPREDLACRLRSFAPADDNGCARVPCGTVCPGPVSLPSCAMAA